MLDYPGDPHSEGVANYDLHIGADDGPDCHVVVRTVRDADDQSIRDADDQSDAAAASNNNGVGRAAREGADERHRLCLHNCGMCLAKASALTTAVGKAGPSAAR